MGLLIKVIPNGCKVTIFGIESQQSERNFSTKHKKLLLRAFYEGAACRTHNARTAKLPWDSL